MRVYRPLVSVITPLYNREDYIEKCIDSVIWQTYPHWELILIDDGSTDSSVKKCKAYMKDYGFIRMFTNDRNRGVAYSRNRGLDEAEGEYIIFLDSDDFITGCYIERLLQIAREQDCEMVQCKLSWGNSLESRDSFDKDANYNMTVHRDRADASQSLQDGRDSRLGGMVCGKLYHKRLFDNIRFPLGKIHEDEAVMHRLVYEANGIACISAAMYFQVDSESSIMRDTFTKTRYDIIDQLEDRYQFYLEKGLQNCAYITAQRLGGQLIELYRKTKEHLGEENQELLQIYRDTLPRYFESPFMTEEKKKLHQLWLDHPEEGEWYFSISFMREEFNKTREWAQEWT